MRGKQKNLTDSQSELVATYLPNKLQQSKKLTTSVKLVLANIYQLHYLQKNWGKRTVFRNRRDFLNDIEAKDKQELNRPRDFLVKNDMITYIMGTDGLATEYILNDELYQLLPTQIRGVINEKFTEIPKYNQLNNSTLQNEEMGVISPSHNELINSELQHFHDPSGTGTGTVTNNPDCSGTCTREINDKNKTTMELNEYYEQYRKQNEELFEQSDDFDPSEHSDIAEMVRLDAGVHRNEPSDFDYINAWVTKKYDRLRSLIQLMRDTWDEQSIKNYSDEILSIFDKVHEHYVNGWFTEKQADAFQSFINNYNSIVEGRNNYFNGKSTKKATVTNAKETTSDMNDTNTPISSDVISESGQEGGCAAAAPKPTKKKYSSFDDFDVEEWKKHVKSGGLEEQFNKPARTHKKITMAEVYAGQSIEPPTVEEPEIPYGQAE